MTAPSKSQFFLGCAIWAKKEWVGSLYPSGSRPADFFRLYSRRFTTVEGNTTFYVVPDEVAIARWAAEAPLGFELCPKLPRDLTHQGRLEPSVPGALRFVSDMRGLGSRLGPIFAQVPRGMAPTASTTSTVSSPPGPTPRRASPWRSATPIGSTSPTRAS